MTQDFIMLGAVKRTALAPDSSIETLEHCGQKCWSIHGSRKIMLLSTSGKKQPVHWQDCCQLSSKQTCLTQVWSTTKENWNPSNPNSPIGCPHRGSSDKLECFTLNASFLGSHEGFLRHVLVKPQYSIHFKTNKSQQLPTLEGQLIARYL